MQLKLTDLRTMRELLENQVGPSNFSVYEYYK